MPGTKALAFHVEIVFARWTCLCQTRVSVALGLREIRGSCRSGYLESAISSVEALAFGDWMQCQSCSSSSSSLLHAGRRAAGGMASCIGSWEDVCCMCTPYCVSVYYVGVSGWCAWQTVGDSGSMGHCYLPVCFVASLFFLLCSTRPCFATSPWGLLHGSLQRRGRIIRVLA